jgi:hypothetical protein
MFEKNRLADRASAPIEAWTNGDRKRAEPTSVPMMASVAAGSSRRARRA